MDRTSGGFTLLQTLVALAVLCALLAVALPTLSHASAVVRSTNAREELTASLIDAGRTATMSGGRVVVCPTLGGAQCARTTDWTRGWIAFEDRDGNDTFGPGDRLVSLRGDLGPGVGLVSTAGRTRLVFQQFGRNAGSNVTFTLCDRRGALHAQTLVLSNTGRLRKGDPSAAGTASCLATLR